MSLNLPIHTQQSFTHLLKQTTNRNGLSRQNLEMIRVQSSFCYFQSNGNRDCLGLECFTHFTLGQIKWQFTKSCIE